MTAAGRPQLPGGRPPAWLAHAPPVDRPWIPHPLGVIELLDRGFSVLRSEWPSLGPAVVGAVLPLADLLLRAPWAQAV